jgi:hypothetical protein
VYRINYNKTFILTVRIDTLRLFLVTVAAEDLECFYSNIKNAFTKFYIKELNLLKAPKEVYVKKEYVLKVL